MPARTIAASKTLLLLAASGIALSGCKIDNRPLLARGGPPPAALQQPGPIDPAMQTPYYAGDAQIVPARAYPYAERAYGLDRAFYDAPPDYGFYYGDEEPWVWQTADDSLMFAEPYDDGYRYYYYQPGDPYPYFVRDADYGYALGPDGALLALFTAAGALLSADSYDRYYPEAHDYWSRGYSMYQDYGRAPRQPVDPNAWSQRAPVIARTQQAWIAAPQAQPAWRAWRNSDAGRAVVQRADAVRPARGRQIAQMVPTAEAARMAQPGPEGRRGGFRGWNAGPAMAEAQAGRGMRFAGPGPRMDGGPAVARNEARAFAPPRGAPSGMAGAPSGMGRAPSVMEYGRHAAYQAPPERFAATPSEAAHGWRRAESQAQAAPTPPHGGGDGFSRQGFARPESVGHGWGGGGPAHVAQAAPPPAQPHGGGWRGGGGGPHGGGAPQSAPHPQPAPQAHPAGGPPHGGGGGGGGGPHGGGQDHGGGNGHKHGG